MRPSEKRTLSELAHVTGVWHARAQAKFEEFAVDLAEYAKAHSAENRRQLAKEGKALSDGSYPIADAEDLKSALTLARSGHGNVSAAMALIRKRAKQLGVTLPEGT